MEEKKKKKVSIPVFIILIIVFLILGWVGGYFLSDKMDELLGEKTNEPKEEQQKQEEEPEIVKLTDEEVAKLVVNVPLYAPSTITDVKDAYQDGLVTANEVDSKTLLSIASAKIDNSKILKYESGMPQASADVKSMFNEIVYFKAEDLKEVIKTLYNFDLKENVEFISPGNENPGTDYMGTVFAYKDGYYLSSSKYTRGTMSTKNSEIIDHEQTATELTVTERFGLSGCDEGGCSIYNKHALGRENAVFSCGYINTENCGFNLLADFFSQNKDKFNTYKHTFKQDDNGNYYWYSTELVK